MFKDKKVITVMPAYNSARTLQKIPNEVMAQKIQDTVNVEKTGCFYIE